MSGKKSFRVHVATVEDGRLVGTLLRRVERLLDEPAPAAFGRSEDEVLAQLESLALELEVENPLDLERYLWTEEFHARRADVTVHALSAIGNRPVIGTRTTSLRLSFVYCQLEGGGFRVALPRFGWWFVLEDLEIAGRVVEQAIAAAMLGRDAKTIFHFRYRGPEYVLPWSPDQLARRAGHHSAGVDDEHDPALASVAEEWVAKAESGRLLELIGPDPVVEALSPLLEREIPPSLLLVGPSGVGKTVAVQRLAHHLLDRKRGKKGEGRKNVKLWASSADHIVAGMVYLGMWQERVLEIVEALSFEGDYFYVDRLTDIMAPQSDGASIADLMAPAVEANEVSLIAECDERELVRCRHLNPTFVEQFRIVRLVEPEVGPLLEQLRLYLGRRAPTQTLHPGALQRAVAHLAAFRRDSAFPGKAYRFADWLVRESQERGIVSIDPRSMSSAFARYTGLPVEIVSDDLPIGTREIASKLAEGVIGQDAACETVARVLARFKAGLDDPERPVGNLFFVGPTGVGKTELAKQIARYLFGDPNSLHRVDMSEYMLPGAAQRLLEAAPGTVSLASEVRRRPLSVVLFDEIEKAHPEVFDVLLGLLGEGRLSDSAGRLVDFRMTIVVMTSNLGARATRAAGFGERVGNDFASAVERHFRPEFFNRLDHVVPFSALSEADVRLIVDLEIDRVRERVGLQRRKLALRLSDAARAELAARGHDPQFGARPLKRLIEERIVAPLAVRMAEDPGFRDRAVAVVAVGEVGDFVV